MSLPWVRLDCGFPTNPKVLMLIEDKQHRALMAYVCGLAYCGSHGTDGFIPMSALTFIHATKKDAETLSDVALWRPCPGGWEVNGWLEFQPSNAENADRKKRAQDAAAARWRKRNGAGARA